MTKTVLAALAVLFTLSAPAFASITGDHRAVVQQEEPASSPEQPAGEGEGSGGGGD